MAQTVFPLDWLRHYGNTSEYKWQRTTSATSGQTSFSRPIGLVESSFDSDGRYYEGRADMNCHLELNIKSNLSKEDYRERILLAWTFLRCRHLLIQAKTQVLRPGGEVRFVVDVAGSLSRAVEDAGEECVFLEDYYEEQGGVEWRDWFVHCQNGKRVIRPERGLARLFVLPVTEEGERVLRLHFIFAHEMSDGLSAYVWMRNMIVALNEPISVLKTNIIESLTPETIAQRLPPPQEALYPSIPGSIARQRWFWAITRILRHVRKPLPSGFSNPLRRRNIKGSVPLSPAYDKVLDYTATPPLNTIPVFIHVSARNTQRLHAIARSTNASIGAAVYALAALCMMEAYETQYPDIPLAKREAFTTGFPLNPRAFFNFHTEPESMMLAFSDGIALPFLPSSLPVEGRLRLLTRQANRQLGAYQKRLQARGEDMKKQFLQSRGAGLVLANQYLYSLERADAQLPEQFRKGINLQGAYPPRPNPTMRTCGVSSVGNRDVLIKSGLYDVHDPGKEFVVDFRNLNASVRARPGEFLVGIAGTREGLFSALSIDMTSMDPVLVERWKERFETALDREGDIDRGRSKNSENKARL